ncbi:MAG: winged helix-turn-helix transcriptional regulator [Spirochaetes bacterium]|nr:winged helix-turn-helix transcriptional regulator [Spirochaetota bacterium]
MYGNGIGLYILPVNSIPENGFEYPFIAYGKIELLRIAVIKNCMDYLREPWGVPELIFRMDRFKSLFGHGSVNGESKWKLNNCRLEYNGREVELTYPEGCIFNMLLLHKGKLVSREVLSYSLWGELPSVKSRVIDVHISALRRKIRYLKEDDGGNPIHSVRGYGYRFNV